MQPGAYPGLPFERYHAEPGISNTLMGRLKKSPLHAKHYLDTPQKPTESMILGSAVHCAIFERERFDKQYVTEPAFDRRTKAGKDGSALFRAECEAKCLLPITEDQMTACRFMQASVWAQPNARMLLESVTEAELSLFWHDDFCRVDCKARLDALVAPFQTILDLKTTKDASRAEFERSVYKYGYYRQAGHYITGADKLQLMGGPVRDYVIIAVENVPPFACALYRVEDDKVALGKRECIALMTRWRKCIESGVYEGYPEDIQPLGIPTWAQREIEQQTTEDLYQ